MREVDIVISGGTILTLDNDNSQIDNGLIAINGDEIVDMGKNEDLKDTFRGKKKIDATDCLVMPGLINAHTHAAMTCFRGIADDMELMHWLNNYIFPAEAKNVDLELAYWAASLPARK